MGVPFLASRPAAMSEYRMGASGALLVELCCSEVAAVFEEDSALPSGWDVFDDEVGNAFDGFLKTTILGVRKDGVSRWYVVCLPKLMNGGLAYDSSQRVAC